jgi:septal ring factor EnvC (AmiA/AmiB activator)
VKTSGIQNSKLKIKNLWLAMVFPPLTCLPSTLWAQDAPSAPTADSGQIKKDLHKNKKDLAELQKKIEEQKEQKHQDEIKEKKVLGRLERVDQVLGKLRREKEANEADLKETGTRLDGLRSDMAENQQELAQSRQLLKQRLRALYRMSFRQPFLGGILDSDNFGDLARKLKFEMILAQGNEKLLSQTLANEEQLEQKSDEWNDEEQRKKRILSVLGRQETNYSREHRNRTIFLASIQRQKEEKDRMIAELSQAAQDLQEKVSSFLEQAAQAEKNQAVWIPAGAGLKIKRGKINWPVDGTIIQSFGKSRNAQFKEVVDNTGIQIQAPEGTPFRAVADGKVRFADWFKGYGKLVILDHGEGYYSLYAQAAELDVTEGQTVSAGQILGTVGDTGSLVGTSLYFEIRKNGIPQNPTLWLKQRS